MKLDNDRLLTATEVQDFLNISETSLWRKRKDSKFPRPYKLGGNALRWRREEIAHWLESQREV
ncbi:helix-turn-helix transcriptional regulator [Flavobacterium sp. W21_SRS_FM6]|uniref:helix-turn-helix transcriptional regulator n=1 Tax=Flavobacterium sp. W21_SRS_FM6 TaxID=3240268 RepID=UPI003F923539